MDSCYEILDNKENEFTQINKLYDECLDYLKSVKDICNDTLIENQSNEINDQMKHENKGKMEDVDHMEVVEKEDKRNSEPSGGISSESVKSNKEILDGKSESSLYEAPITDYKVENEIKNKNEHTNEKSVENVNETIKSERLRKISLTLPKIIITHSNTSLTVDKEEILSPRKTITSRSDTKNRISAISNQSNTIKSGYGDYPRRLISKNGIENVALISNVPYERIRMLNDTFHTLINVRWRWIIWGTVCVHFAIWLVFAVFWYVAALAHYDLEPDPPTKTCITGGNDFLTIFLASVEAQTTIGFGDRTIDEECPESIFLFIMQLILGTGLSGVLTCVVYAKLTRPEKLSRDGVGFSKKAVISMRDGKLCLMVRAWDLNYDHIIGSDFNAHFVKTYRTKEGEVIRYYARSLELQQRQFLLWPLTLVHVIDEHSPLYNMTPTDFANFSYEITVSLKGASASMGTFTQSQTSYLPREIVWAHRFPPVIRYDRHKQKYLIDHNMLNTLEPVDTPLCSASQLANSNSEDKSSERSRSTRASFNDRLSAFHLQRSSSFRNNETKV